MIERPARFASVAIALLVVALLVVGCGEPDPRYGEATLSAAAPHLTLSGTTFGEAAALELAPGCPGYLDADIPGHTIVVNEEIPFTVQARSESGPLALAVANGDEVLCDSDDGSGHSPTLSFGSSGRYLVYVAALRTPAELPYELTIDSRGAPTAQPGTSAPVASGPRHDVSVTMTSDPPGAQVRDAGGDVVGTTPAMFVVSVPQAELGQPRTWSLSLAGHANVDVTGTLREGALVLHGQLPTSGPVDVEVTASEPQPVRDFATATLAVDVAEACPISVAEVEVDIRHPFIGDLRVVLHPPEGETISLHRHTGGGSSNIRRTWSTSSANSEIVSLVGRTTRGRWMVRVHDDAGSDQGTFESFRLHLQCGTLVALAPSSPPTTNSQILNPWASPPTPPPPTPAVTPPTRPRRPARPRLPSLPTHADVVRVLSTLRPRVESCSTGGGTVRVLATIRGSNGRVTHVSSSGSASQSERQCVERVVRTARFPRFSRSELDVDHMYDLPARQPGALSPGF